jgi:AcrR family transcriptional regulator
MTTDMDDKSARGEREQLILRAAMKVFTRKGFHKARMADIATEANVSYGLAYHYFESKDALFDSIQAWWWERLFKRLDEIALFRKPVSEKLEAIVAYLLDLYHEEPELVHVFITEMSRSSQTLTVESLNNFKRFIGSVDTMISLAQKKKQIRTDVRSRYLTYMFLGGLETVVSSMVLERQPLDNSQARDRLLKGVLDVFLTGALGRTSA